MTLASAPDASRSRATCASLRLAILLFVADPQWLVPSTIAPIIFGLVSFELFRAGDSPYFLTYAILGAGMMSMWGQTLYGSGWATGQDRQLGTLEPTIQAPTPYLYVVLGRIIWNVIAGLFADWWSTSSWWSRPGDRRRCRTPSCLRSSSSS
jgi:hypothetical protein